jgi:hypothetical protein
VVQRDEKPKECTKKREDPFLSHSHLMSTIGTSFTGFRKPYKNNQSTGIKQVWRKSRYLTISTSRKDRSMIRRCS